MFPIADFSGVIVISGEAESGKTILARHLLNQRIMHSDKQQEQPEVHVVYYVRPGPCPKDDIFSDATLCEPDKFEVIKEVIETHYIYHRDNHNDDGDDGKETKLDRYRFTIVTDEKSLSKSYHVKRTLWHLARHWNTCLIVKTERNTLEMTTRNTLHVLVCSMSHDPFSFSLSFFCSLFNSQDYVVLNVKAPPDVLNECNLRKESKQTWNHHSTLLPHVGDQDKVKAVQSLVLVAMSIVSQHTDLLINRILSMRRKQTLHALAPAMSSK
jgi:hypothetical protein